METPTTISTEAENASAGRYIIRIAGGTEAVNAVAALIPSDRISHRYSEALNGFAAELTDAQVQKLRGLGSLVDVTPDKTMHLAAEQVDPTWGLDRIDQGPTAGDGRYRYHTTGAGVTAYVLDTGVRATHSEFGGRVTGGWDFIDNDADARTDCNGHGTHVAGTIAGKTYGAAKEMNIVPLRIWDCAGNGFSSSMIAAVDWVIMNRTGPAVINISGSGAASAPRDEAVARAVASGISVVVAAGNDQADACGKSPGSAPSALTVGATASGDRPAGNSNYGPCLDVWAPGVGVLSAGPDSDTAALLMTGTSMAAPHVTGVVGRLLQTEPNATPARLASLVTSNATPVIFDNRGSPNGLLHIAGSAAPSAPRSVAATTDTAKRTATLTWSAPASDGGSPITGYRVARDADDATGPGPWSTVLPATARSHTFTNLIPGSTYNLTVTATNATGDGATGTVAAAVPVATAAPSAPTPVPVYRFYSPTYQGHFYTASAAERDHIIRTWPDVWRYEAEGYRAFETQAPGTVPLYRFWSSEYNGHFYTVSTEERDMVIRTWPDVWRYEGIAYFVYPMDTSVTASVPVARFWSHSAKHHFYTNSAAERDMVIRTWPDVWAYESETFRVPN